MSRTMVRAFQMRTRTTCWSRSCAATAPATWTRPQASASAFRSRARSCWPTAASCRCTTENHMGYGFGFKFRFRSRPGVPRPETADASSGKRFAIGRALVEIRDRLKTVVAGPAVPEIRSAAGRRFDPGRESDRLAALGAGILLGQEAETWVGHGVLPISCFVYAFFRWSTNETE